jgi:Mn-dependent DtxR family transcriptional regulator
MMTTAKVPPSLRAIRVSRSQSDDAARVDIAARLGVSHAAVVTTITRLQQTVW